MPAVPLSVLDLVPLCAGSSPGEAVRCAVDLAQRTEQLGYQRYWFAEHHLNPGLVGVSPAVAMALVAGSTSAIRLGAAGFLLGHRTPLSVVEEVGLIDALHPGRVDVGLGRSAGRPPGASLTAEPPRATRTDPGSGELPHVGVVIPPPFDPEAVVRSPRFALRKRLMLQPGAVPAAYAEQVSDVLALLEGRFEAEGLTAHAMPGESAQVQVWVLGSGGGESAAVAGANGLRFVANYHVAPAGVLDAVRAYRSAFRRGEGPAGLDHPHVAVSADVVVADDDASAERLAAGYGPWVRSIRTGEGAIAYPSPDRARALPWGDGDDALVADRVATRFVGSAQTVAGRLRALQEATGADELVITTITHEHADRVRSYELLAKEWLGGVGGPARLV